MLGEKEFTKLQGYIGMNYASKSGENDSVALAVYEHYMPRGQRDSLPSSRTGSIVALADKIDTVCGIIGVGMIPTGSNDPFALRRAANGIVQIISEENFILDLHGLIDHTLKILSDKIEDPGKTREFLYDYFRQRVHWLLKESKIDYDVIDSVMHIDYSDIMDLKHRAQDLQKFKQREDFRKLVIGFKRVSNIIAEAKNLKEPDPALLREEAEQDLYSGYKDLALSVNRNLESKDYQGIMDELVKFGVTIDRFFDEVLVNVEDPELKENRYNLLSVIRSLFLKVADIAKIVIEGN
jgi:glycyl-tRNA synthetase beta chain